MAKLVKQVKVAAKVVKTPAKVREVIAYTCDVCGLPADRGGDNRYGSGMSSCSICKRDLCRRNQARKGPTCFEWDPDETGDYPDKYCNFCYPLFVEARREMQHRHWQEEEALERSVKIESLKKGP